MAYIDLNLYPTLIANSDGTFTLKEVSVLPSKTEMLLRILKKRHLKNLIEKGIDVDENKRELEILYLSR